jgi:hypothetical protein
VADILYYYQNKNSMRKRAKNLAINNIKFGKISSENLTKTREVKWQTLAAPYTP